MVHTELILNLAKLGSTELTELLQQVKQQQKTLAQNAMDAVKAGDAEMLLIAIDAGADLSGPYGFNNAIQAVEIAIGRQDDRVLGILLDASRSRFPSVYSSALVIGVYTAVKQGSIGAYNVIRDHIASHNAYDAWSTGVSPFHNTNYTYHVSLNGRVELAAENGHADMVAHLIAEWPGFADFEYPYRLLAAAVKSGNPAVLACLLNGGLQDKTDAFTCAAIDAVKVGDDRSLKLLIEAGLSLEAPSGCSKGILGRWADSDPLQSVRWVLTHEAGLAQQHKGRIAELLG